MIINNNTLNGLPMGFVGRCAPPMNVQDPLGWYWSARGKTAFGTELSGKIEKAFNNFLTVKRAGKVSTEGCWFSFELNGELYGVDFEKMLQKNLKTGKERKIERIVNYTWKWQGKHWYDFDLETCRILESNLTQGLKQFHVLIEGHLYYIDLNQMQQTNKSTNRVRKIGRFFPSQSTSPSVSPRVREEMERGTFCIESN